MLEFDLSCWESRRRNRPTSGGGGALSDIRVSVLGGSGDKQDQH